MTDQDILAELGISHNQDIDDESIMNLALAISLQDPKIVSGENQMDALENSEKGSISSQLANSSSIGGVPDIHQSTNPQSENITGIFIYLFHY